MNPKVEIYTTNYCGYCFAAVRLLKKYKVDFEQIDVTGDPEARVDIAKRSGQRTVPQVFWDGKSIGGYTELAAQIKDLVG